MIGDSWETTPCLCNLKKSDRPFTSKSFWRVSRRGTNPSYDDCNSRSITVVSAGELLRHRRESDRRGATTVAEDDETKNLRIPMRDFCLDFRFLWY